jgi:hypothetical protein
VAACDPEFHVDVEVCDVNARDEVTRFDAELVDAAAAEGARQSRSARQQLAHWVRVGRAVTSVSSSQRARVEAALAGDLALSALSGEEALVVNAEISAGIEERLSRVDVAAELAADGITTVALDEQGNLVEHHPGGTTTLAAL